MLGASVLVLAVTSAASCSSDSATIASAKAAHTEGRLIWSNDPHLWADVERDRFDARRTENTASDEHVVPRLQAWVDRYDTAVRAIVHQRDDVELVAPRPRVRLVIEPDINASISTVPACIGAVGEAPAASPRMAPMVVMRGRRTSSTDAETACLESASWSPESGLAWFNALGGWQVRSGDRGFTVTDGPTIRLHAARVGIVASAPFVNVNTGLVTRLSENGFAVVLAHELAHYYRAHLTTSVEGRYDFWFDRDEALPERPTPVVNQEDYRRQYLRLSVPRFLVPGQLYDAHTATTLLRWVSEMATPEGHVCEPAARTYAALASSVKGELADDARRPLSTAAREAYRDVEQALASCIDALALTDEPEPEGDAVFATTAVSRAWFVRRIAPELRRELRETDVANVLTLRDLVALLDAAGRHLDGEASAFVKRLTHDHVGVYTYEQEADEIAMELGARVGITPAQIIDGFTELMYAVERPDPAGFAKRYGMTADECANLVRLGFRVDGRRVYVPLGPLGDPHHAYCYRLFNLDREREAHAYFVDVAAFPPPIPAWTEIQAAAAKLTDDAK